MFYNKNYYKKSLNYAVDRSAKVKQQVKIL